MTSDEFDAVCRSLPGVTMVVQWGANAVYKVGGKIFAVMGAVGSGSAGCSFKVSDIAYEALIESGRARPAPYLARAKWVRFDDLAALDPAEVEDWLRSAYDIVAGKLTKKARAESGIV
jgi:predicted DNA-binding protein (MmcQ/YjbR family)